MNASPRRRWLGLFCVAVVAGALGACRRDSAPERIDPRPGATISSRIAPGGVQRFAFDLAAGEYLDLAVSQGEADLVVTLRGPGQPEDLRLDTVTPVPAQVPERVRFVAAQGGPHVLEIAGDSSLTAGRFRISIAARRPATDLDRRAAHALAWLAAAERLRRANDPASEERALPIYEEAAGEFAALGDREGEAYARIQWAKVLAGRGQAGPAEKEFRRTLAITSAVTEPALRAVAATELARLLPSLGRGGEAPALLEEALELWRRLRVVSRVAQVENELAIRAQDRGELAEAERLFLAAISDRTAEGNEREVAVVTANLATLYGLAGERKLALAATLRAEARLPADAPAGDRAWLLAKRGEALARLGRLDEAQSALVAGRELHVRERDTAEVAPSDRRLGQLANQRGRYGEAVARYRAALLGFRAMRDLPGEIATLQDLAWTELNRGNLDAAERDFSIAAPRAKKLANPWIEAAAQAGLARVERARGHLDAALARAREALRLAEDLRLGAGSADFGSSVFADRQIYFDLAAELLAERFAETGDPAIAAEAFEVAERSRARRLLDLLAESPRLSAAPLSLAAIRRALDDETILLEFDLGDEASLLWVVTRRGLTHFLLPGRARIEPQIEQALEVLANPGATADSVQAQRTLDETTKLLVGAALPTLRAPRWLIVADGALQALPLGALPDPQHPGQPILAAREVVYAPSASVAVQLAERVRQPSATGPELAVFGDPIYGATDERLGKAALPTLNDSGHELDLPRLFASGAEARRILDLVPPSKRIEALGFDATKERILSGELAHVRRLHFAVHGLPNREQPELSSLALSRYGRDGRPRDGTLHAREIAALHLTADLAVLSACQSGQGTQIAGEGLVGLAHAFLAAGTTRVVASYWPIQDAATAELMARFYDGLLRRRLSPSLALQQAQLSMAREERWRRPYYWAGFSVQGGF
jgi:CHAT domain-containing protein